MRSGPIAAFIRDELGRELHGRLPDRGGGPSVGRPGRPLEAERSHSRRTPSHALRSSRTWSAPPIANAESRAEVDAAGGGAGRAAARGDARRARSVAVGGLHRDRGGDRKAARHGGDPDGALRGRADRDRGGQLGSRLKASLPVGSRVPLGGEDAVSRVLRTRRPARIDDYARASGTSPSARALDRHSRRRGHARSSWKAGCGARWSPATTQDEPLPPETESRLGQFTRADGHRDRQRRVARRGGAARGRAGRAAAGGDAGRAGGASPSAGVRGGRRRRWRSCSASTTDDAVRYEDE